MERFKGKSKRRSDKVTNPPQADKERALHSHMLAHCLSIFLKPRHIFCIGKILRHTTTQKRYKMELCRRTRQLAHAVMGAKMKKHTKESKDGGLGGLPSEKFLM